MPEKSQYVFDDKKARDKARNEEKLRIEEAKKAQRVQPGPNTQE